MKQKQTTVIAIVSGIACALCLALFMWGVRGQTDAARAEVLARYGGEQVEICVAARDIAAGERVDSSAVEMKLWVADLLPDGAIGDSGQVVGRTATASILKGEAISEKRFEESHGSLNVPAGKEAVSVPAKAVQAVGGAIGAGMNVDVYSSGDAETVLLAEDVAVLDSSVVGTGGLVSSDGGWLTLAVDSERVEEIISASRRTTLYFVLSGGEAPSGDGANAADVAVADDGENAASGASLDATAPESESAESADAGDAAAKSKGE